MIKPSQGSTKLIKGQSKISTFGPNGENRHKFVKKTYPKNPQNQLLNDEPLEVLTIVHLS